MSGGDYGQSLPNNIFGHVDTRLSFRGSFHSVGWRCSKCIFPQRMTDVSDCRSWYSHTHRLAVAVCMCVSPPSWSLSFHLPIHTLVMDILLRLFPHCRLTARCVIRSTFSPSSAVKDNNLMVTAPVGNVKLTTSGRANENRDSPNTDDSCLKWHRRFPVQTFNTAAHTDTQGDLVLSVCIHRCQCLCVWVCVFPRPRASLLIKWSCAHLCIECECRDVVK